MRPAAFFQGMCVATALLFCASAYSQNAALAPSLVPGSATMPLKPLKQPEPDYKPGNKLVSGIKLGVWVRADGTVDSVDVLQGDPALKGPVLQAVRNWTFEPAIWEGKAIPARVEVSFGMINGVLVNSLSPVPNLPGELHAEGEFGVTLPVLKQDPDLVMPILARATRGRLEAGFSFIVERDGLPSQFEVLGANSESAYRAMINQLANQVYTPGKIRDEAVRVRQKQVFSTMSIEKPIEDLAGLVEAMDPVYPFDLLMAGTSGSAKVNFTLAPDGTVKTIEVAEASHPDFGLALAAAVEGWQFAPEAAVEKTERSYTHEFSAEALPGGVSRLISMLRKGQSFSNSTAKLSGKPERAYSPALSYPLAMRETGVAGKAKIEFVIDRSGLAQIPRIVEASNPTFGWAAATWIGSMRFKQLQRAGEPTDLRVVVPVNFPAPKAP